MACGSVKWILMKKEMITCTKISILISELPKNIKEIRQKSEIEKRYEEAPKLYGVKMKAEQRRRIETYYNNSVRQLENWLKKDLTSIWF